MVRTHIQLTEDQVERAEVRKRALSVIGCVRSKTGDLSVNHDRYLEEAYNR